MKDLGLILDAEDLKGIGELAVRAEDAGFHSVWATELYRTSFQQLSTAAHATKRIKLGTAVALAFVRSPLVTALTALDLDELSSGRLILGLGSGARRTNELWHGINYGKPVAKIKECIEIIRLLIASSHGGGISYKGSHYQIDLKGYRRAFEPFRTQLPIFLAGIGANMSRASGAVADGYIGHVVCSLKYLREVVLPSIRCGIEEAGRSRSNYTVATIITCAISNDTRRALDAARRTIAFYATVKTYDPPFRLHGFERETQRVRKAFMEGDIEGMIAGVSDDMVRSFAVVGNADECRRRVEEYRCFVDLPILSAPHYFLDFEEVSEYQRAILDVFGS